MTPRQEAESAWRARHREELDAARRALRESGEAELDKVKAQLREEQHKSAARIASLEDVNREMAARGAEEAREKMRELESSTQAKVEQAFQEAAERSKRVEKTWRERLDKAEAQSTKRIGDLEKQLASVKVPFPRSHLLLHPHQPPWPC